MIFILVLLFTFGLIIGSFLNVLIDRMPRSEQIFKGRSHCDKCKHTLGVFDLLPVVSLLALGGKCRYCHAPIPYRNSIVELFTGLLFVANFLYLSNIYPIDSTFIVLFCIQLIVTAILIVVFFIDLEHQLIPDLLVNIAFILVVASHLTDPFRLSIINYLVSAACAFLFFLFLWFITKKKGMGGGDVKFAGFMGLYLGYPKTIQALYAAFLTGAIVSVMLIVGGKKRFGQTIAFGPFLIIGTFVAYYGLLQPLFEKFFS